MSEIATDRLRRLGRRAAVSTLLTATASAAILFGASPAYAIGPTTVSLANGQLTVQAAAGTDNNLTIGESTDTIFIRELSGGVLPHAGSGCVHENGTGQVRCSKAGVTAVVVRSGDFNDRISVGAPSSSAIRFTLLAGSGNDTIGGNTPRSVFRGEAGDDYVSSTSSTFVTTLDGGTGRDRCPGSRNVTDIRISCESQQ